MQPINYDLYAICLHLGAELTTGGHYVTYARCADGLWYRFDDSRVSRIDIDSELTSNIVRENAYLMFYQMTTI